MRQNLSPVSVRRLTKLAAFLDTVPRKHFHFGNWASKTFLRVTECKKNVKMKELHQCGTTACALGWAATMPAFKRVGLRLDFDVFNEGVISYEVNKKVKHAGSLTVKHIAAAMSAFNLSYREAYYLFVDGDDDMTPKQWATHCRRFIKIDGQVAN